MAEVERYQPLPGVTMRLLSLSLLVALTGCSVAPSSSETSAVDAASVSEAAAEQLVGTYAVRIDLASLQTMELKNLPFALKLFAPRGETKGSTTLFRLAEITRTEKGLAVTEKNCAVSFPKGGIKYKISTDVIESAGLTTTDLNVTEMNNKISISRGNVTQIVGATLANPLTDTLPTDNDNAKQQSSIYRLSPSSAPFAVTNVTVAGFTANVYFAQRSTTSYSATLNSNGSLSGLIKDNTEQNLIGAAEPAFNQIMKSHVTIRPDPDASKSTVKFEKISDAPSCESVISHYNVTAE